MLSKIKANCSFHKDKKEKLTEIFQQNVTFGSETDKVVTVCLGNLYQFRRELWLPTNKELL